MAFQFKREESSFLNTNDLDSTFLKGQTTSRTTLIMGEKQNNEANTDPGIIVMGGIQNINIMQNKQNIPVGELGSCATALVDGRLLPVNISMTKQYVNGKGLLASFVDLIYGSGQATQTATLPVGPLVEVETFLLSLYNTTVKKPFNMYISTYLDGVDGLDGNIINHSVNRLNQCFIESYSVTVDANYGVIQESLTLQASYVSIPATKPAITTGYYTAGKPAGKTPTTLEFANPGHLNDISSGTGLANAYTFTLTVLDTGFGKTDVSGHRAIGGIGSFQFSVAQPLSPVPEVGSNRFVLVPGKTQPFQLSFTKAFVNGRSLVSTIQAINDAPATNPANTPIDLNLAVRTIKGVKKLGIVISNLLTNNYDFVEFDQCAYTSGGFSTGDGIVNMENATFIGAGIKQKKGKLS